MRTKTTGASSQTLLRLLPLARFLLCKLAPLLPHPTPAKQTRPRPAVATFLRRFSPTRLLLVALLAGGLILLPTWLVLERSFDTPEAHNALWAEGGVALAQATPLVQFKAPLTPEEQIAELVLHGGVIMPKLGNETVKAELGRASWKLLHTMAARFPEHPTESERDAFKSFIYLFSRLYPCGECAAHFQELLRKHPPQTATRGAASLHLCHLHNLVNERLGKEEFDCSANLEGVYDCGCAEDPVGNAATLGTLPKGKSASKVGARAMRSLLGDDTRRRDPMTGAELVGG